MKSEGNEFLDFDAYHIMSVELKPEIASNCKLRSSFVHEKLLETKNNLSGNPLLLKLSNKGLNFLIPDSQTLILSHSIHHISYTACDRSSCQFSMVARSPENGNSQFCHILRLNSVEEADTINRYIGSLFKDLNQKRKNKKSEGSGKCVEGCASKPPVVEDNSTKVKDPPTSLQTESGNVYDDLDARLRRISTPHIDELVSEKHYVRRLSLCMPSPTIEEQNNCQEPQNLHSSLEKKQSNIHSVPQSVDYNKPILRKKSDFKSNKISAVIERLSFRASRDLSTDLLKYGSPVVALKEQLEFSDRYGEKGPACSNEDNRGAFSQPKKWFQSHSNDSGTNRNLVGGIPRKNSSPVLLDQTINNTIINDEQPPIPPVRINSLRNMVANRSNAFVGESPLVRCKQESSSLVISGGPLDQDDDLSSITTPSSCDDNHGDQNIDEPQMSNIDISCQFGKSRISNNNKMNFCPLMNDNQYRSFNHNFVSHENYNPNIQLNNFFKNFSKEETTEYLLNKELGSFILRNSASHKGCYALSVKVSEINVSHYIIQSLPTGFQIKGLDKNWPSLHSLITHLSVIPEMLPCPLQLPPMGLDRKMSTPSFQLESHAKTPFTMENNLKKQTLPQSKSAEEEYQLRMKHFLNDTSIPGQEQYQQLSDFSSMIASFDLN